MGKKPAENPLFDEPESAAAPFALPQQTVAPAARANPVKAPRYAGCP